MLERDDFAKRFAAGRPISIMEFLYPLLQGYDSVAVRADVELGGTDQTFNLLVGRDLQRAWGQDPQVALTVPLLEGTDGVQKMSQSLGNYIGITEPADAMFGKLMSIKDELIGKYLLLCTDLDAQEASDIEEGLAEGRLHPNEQKRFLARTVTDLYHGAGAGDEAEERFDLLFRQHEPPQDVEERRLPAEWARSESGLFWLPGVIEGFGLARSRGEARRLIQQGGVRLGGERVSDPDLEYPGEALRGRVLQVGKLRFVKIR
jgi:tyrosyl-tRNA synthetase